MNHTTSQTTQMLSARELAELLKLAPDTVRRAAKKGAIPSLKLGGALRFTEEHIAQITERGFQWPKTK
jgi:excisionase family DNA binding protein